MSFTTPRVLSLFLSLLLAPLIFLIDLLANLYYWFYEDKFVKTDGKAVLITGCDTGFGRLAAELFASRGVKTFAGCLTDDGMRTLQGLNSASLEPFRMDVTSEESTWNALELVTKRCEEQNLKFWGVVSNAGVTNPPAPGDWFSYDEYYRVININLLGHIRTVTTFLPLVKKVRGRIAIMVSIAGHLPSTGLTPYCASKHGILGFANALRTDLGKKGVKIATVAPEFYNTDIVHAYQHVEGLWNKLSDELKAEYPLEQVKSAQNKAMDLMLSFARANDPNDIAHIYYHAMFGKVPRMTYYTGRLVPVFESIKHWPDYLINALLTVREIA